MADYVIFMTLTAPKEFDEEKLKKAKYSGKPIHISQELETLNPNGGGVCLITFSESEYKESELEITIRCTDLLGEQRSYLFRKSSGHWHRFLVSSRNPWGGIYWYN